MKRRLSIIIKAIIAILCIAAVAAALLAADLKYYARTPLNTTSGNSDPTVFIIRPGDGFRSITHRLVNLGVIQSPFKFRVISRVGNYDKQIKAGEYHLSSNQSPHEILKKFIAGDVILYRLTVPEGYNLVQIAQLAATAGLVEMKQFLNVAHDARFISSLNIDVPSLEGYLFPDTYHFPRSVDPQTIIRTMVRRLKSVVTPQLQEAAQQKGFTLHEVLTLASIIEKETGAPQERALISSVFHNRLKKKMRLESDPTVIYGIPDFNGNLTRKHLRTPGPYNTYLNTGLPPGPIASPGAEAIKAVLYPEKTRFLFFVSKKDGTHHFSTHFSAHKKAVRKYQLNR